MTTQLSLFPLLRWEGEAMAKKRRSPSWEKKEARRKKLVQGIRKRKAQLMLEARW